MAVEGDTGASVDGAPRCEASSAAFADGRAQASRGRVRDPSQQDAGSRAWLTASRSAASHGASRAAGIARPAATYPRESGCRCWRPRAPKHRGRGPEVTQVGTSLGSFSLSSAFLQAAAELTRLFLLTSSCHAQTIFQTAPSNESAAYAAHYGLQIPALQDAVLVACSDPKP